MSKRIYGRWKLYLFLIAAVLFFAFNANIPPMGLDESMYMTASQEMGLSHNYSVPFYNGEPFFDKPPMTYWLQNITCGFFDVFLRGARLDTSAGLPTDGRLFGYRAASAISALVLLGMILFAGKRLFSPRTAIYSGFAFVLSILTCALAKMAIMDMLLAMWCTLSLLIFILTYLHKIKKQWIILAFGALGAALLTKGPIAFGIVGLPVLCFLIAHKKLGFMFDKWTLAGSLLMAAIAVPWYLVVQYETGTFFREFFIHQNLQRALGQDFAHSYNPLFYVGIILAGMAPWCWFLVPSIIKYCKSKKTLAAEQFLSLWVISLFLMFTLINSRLPGYIFPVFPAGALLVGRYLDTMKQSGTNKAMLLCSMFFSLLFGLVVAAAPWFLSFQSVFVKVLFGLAGLWYAGFGIASLIKYLKSAAPIPALICQAMGFLILFIAALPFIALNPDTLKDEIDTRSDYLGTTGYVIAKDFDIASVSSDVTLIGYGLHPLSVNFPFFAQRQVLMPANKEELKKIIENSESYFLVTDMKHLREEKLGQILPGQAVIDEKYMGKKNGLFISRKY